MAYSPSNRDIAEFSTDQALYHAIRAIDARLGPDYAQKNPALVGAVFVETLNQKNILDSLDREEDEVEVLRSVTTKDSETKCEMTLKILQENFIKFRSFTTNQVYNVIRPYRWNPSVSTFKDEKTFRGTILRELQVLEKRGVLSFVDGKGTYCLI